MRQIHRHSSTLIHFLEHARPRYAQVHFSNSRPNRSGPRDRTGSVVWVAAVVKVPMVVGAVIEGPVMAVVKTPVGGGMVVV